MAHKIAKLHLENAKTLEQQIVAVETSISLGMPRHEIEAYLDWLEVRSPTPSQKPAPRRAPSSQAARQAAGPRLRQSIATS